MSANRKTINAIIGVCYKNGKTLYVKRSDKMENYPGVWSLFSIQFEPNELPDQLDLNSAQKLMDRMSKERLGDAPVSILEYLSSSVCNKNPINSIVKLHLYRIKFSSNPILNPEYYSESAWMTSEEYVEQRGNGLCGSCMRMWSDYCVKTGLSDVQFAPSINDSY